MGRPPKHVDEVERLLDIGWGVRDIVKKTNISERTVYRVIDKLKRRARLEFKNLMSEDFLWKYQKTLENFDKTIRQCNEQIDQITKKYNDLELIALNDLEATPDSKHMARATLISNLITIQSNRTNELQKLVTARDKASDSKARVYNQGPVVNAIDEWVRQTTPAMGDLPRLEIDKPIVTDNLDNINDVKSEPSGLNTSDTIQSPSEDDLKVLKEMEEEDD